MNIDCVSENKILKKKKQGKSVYKCPYCNYKGVKYKCVEHIDKKHNELIPEGYTAARLFFNHINKKSHGTCIVCKRPTEWNEDTWRYDRLCTRPSCKIRYQEIMKKGMINKYGKASLLDSPEHQQKMLERRSISGKYRFKDGAIKTYVGKYEKNLLEYFDKVMNVKSKDVQVPGPTIEYEYNGKTHLWITDMYYLPANLIIEVKDGGDNPNKRVMTSYREKVVAKEKSLAKIGKYNYIRLTDNNFAEFANTIEEIRMNMDNDVKDIVFNVLESATLYNEMGLAGINPTIPSRYNPSMVNLMVNDNVIKTGFSLNDTDIIFIDKDGKIITKKFKDLDTDYITRRSTNQNVTDKIHELTSMVGENIIDYYNPDYLYEFVTGDKIVYNKQPVLDNRFETYIDDNKKALYSIECMYNRLDPCIIEYEPLPILEGEVNYNRATRLVKNYKNLRVLEHPYGYVVENINTGAISKLFTSLEKITTDVLDVVSGGGKYE